MNIMRLKIFINNVRKSTKQKPFIKTFLQKYRNFSLMRQEDSEDQIITKLKNKCKSYLLRCYWRSMPLMWIRTGHWYLELWKKLINIVQIT